MPSTRSVPPLIGEIALIMRIVEDLPAPFGPRKPNASPRRSSKSIAVDGPELARGAARRVDLREAAGLDQEAVSHADTVHM